VFDSRIVSLAILFIFSVSVARPAWSSSPEDATELKEDAAAWASEGWPLLQQYCLDCHNEDNREAGLDLSSLRTIDALGRSNDPMQRVLEMIRFGAMPPEDADQPTAGQRKTLVTSLDRALFAVSCDQRPRPGKVTARRLNRAEYNNSIRDLFGVDLKPAEVFPSDEVGAGFDNNGDVLSLSPMLIEKYLEAAEDVAKKVLIDPKSLPRIDDQRASDQLLVHGETRTGRFNGRFLSPDAFAWADFRIPVTGEYRVGVSGGNTAKGLGPTRVAVYDKDGFLRGHHELKYYGGSGRSERFEFRAIFEKGKQSIFVEPLEQERELEVGKSKSDRFADLDSDLVAAAVKRRETPLKPTGAISSVQYPFMVRHISVSGPTQQPPEAYPPSQQEILRRVAEHRDGEWRGVEKAATECLRPLMRRAFRGPVTSDQVEPYARLVSTATDRGESYYRGLQIAISAILVSPRFLFRVETPPESWEPEDDGSIRLPQHQLATRLAYFLWSSTPDERLLDDADKGRLNQESLLQHARRMIANQKSDSLARQFAAQWLGLRNLEVHEADTDQFQSFTPELRRAMARETELVFMHAVRNNQPVACLLTSDDTFVNGVLASHYGISDVTGEEFEQVSLEQTPRRGVLSHASVLTLTSNPVRTSPVKRGKWILENVLGTPPPEPPAGVPELEEAETAGANASLREQLEIHRADPTCAACHRVMDQLGFGLEQFDAIGRYREKEGSLLIDASGELPGGRVFNGAAELSEILGKTESEAFARTVVGKLMTFALGRELMPSDRCTVDEIIKRTAKQEYRFIDVILEIVNSRPFLYYDWVDQG
jgi:hypothetical protein